jgi:hypothetical protein
MRALLATLRQRSRLTRGALIAAGFAIEPGVTGTVNDAAGTLLQTACGSQTGRPAPQVNDRTVALAHYGFAALHRALELARRFALVAAAPRCAASR